MSSVSFIKQYRKTTQLVAFNRTIHFLPDDNPAWSFEIGTDLAPLEKGRPRKYFDADSDSDEDEPKQQQQIENDGTGEKNRDGQKTQEAGSNVIVALDVNEDRSLLAVATGDKSLYLFEIEATRSLKVLSRRLLSRASSCMKFAASGRFLIVCDKGGDCFKYDCEEVKKPGRWLLGHMSQVLDVLIDPEEKFIITSDRDEKIRVTTHPDCHNIETFCLGHTKFVSHLEFLKHGEELTLISLSGDKTLRWWNYKSGKELARKELDLPGNKLAVQNQAVDGSALLAVLCYKPTAVNIYKLGGTIECEFVQTISLKDQILSTISFDESGHLLGLVIEESTTIPLLARFKFDNENWQLATEATITKKFEDSKLPYVDSVSFLFKKKFDNIKDYQERKRKRIEENSKQLG